MKNFVNFINSINSIINGNNGNIGELRSSCDQFNDAKRLALILSRHPGVEGMRVNLQEIRKELNEHHNGIFTGMKISFTWQGNRVVLSEDYDFEDCARSLILSVEGEELARIFWSVNAGLTALHFRHLSKPENWFLSNVIIDGMWDWSHTSGRLISLDKAVSIGEIKIAPNSDRSTVMATINGKTIPMMGHTLRGNVWWSNDPRLEEAIRVVKKAFTKPF